MAVWRAQNRSGSRSALTAKRRTVTPPSTVAPSGWWLAHVKWSTAHVVSTSTGVPWAARFSASRRHSVSAPPTTPAPKRGTTKATRGPLAAGMHRVAPGPEQHRVQALERTAKRLRLRVGRRRGPLESLVRRLEQLDARLREAGRLQGQAHRVRVHRAPAAGVAPDLVPAGL